jgi:BirA family biotin operon repressor/biotin-[acetyl-CoA-carboxylase] ligase
MLARLRGHDDRDGVGTVASGGVERVEGVMSQPPSRVLQHLVTGPTLISRVVWFDSIGSTNAEVARRAADGAEAGLLVLADEQTTGRGRLGRRWTAPPGTSLMGSLLLRPDRPPGQLALLPLLIGLVLVEACEQHVPGAQLSLKWPNDLLADARKCAGILVEAPSAAVVVAGIGLNVDWRDVERPPELADATSLSEVGRGAVDRWRLLPSVIERVDARYDAWLRDPTGFLPAYRERCATLGATVRVERTDGTVIEGTATGVGADGGLAVDTGGVVRVVHAGDAHHLRDR